MFTGIVTAVGRVDSVALNNVVELRIKASYKGVKKGESIAVNGACLTVEKVVKGGFALHAVQTTLGRTLIGEWQKGRSVNLERAVRAADLMGGHIVQGHVDGVATVARVVDAGDRFRGPALCRCRSCRSPASTRRWGSSAAVIGYMSRPMFLEST